MPPQSTTNGTGANKAGQNNVDEKIDESLHVGRILASPPEGEEVVITGLAGQFPDSNNVYHFQDNLFNKVDMVSKDTRRWEHTHPEIPQRGGKLNAIDKFDAGFFGVHYRQAQAMCPMVRLYLESAIEAIMDAGVHPSDLEGANCGVFVGACFSETERTWFYDRLEPQMTAITGCERSMIANRISYYLKLKGPSFITDTACSSSLYALEQAYRMIRLGQIDCALVGGTNICLHPFVSLQFARLGVLSMDGTCKSFDAEGSGYARSEAICSIFLQKSKDAKRIYCQVVHAKTNCDGYKPQGITYPSGDMQKLLLTEFYEECGVNPANLVFLEAHGTGTKVGDPEECVAIDEVFCKDRTTPLMIGSVKSSIGHTEPTSGLCSITKVIIAMETGYIPPNIHFKKPREGVEPLERGKLKVVTEKTPFENDNGLIGVNSFGFGGGNCHVLLKWNSKNKTDASSHDNLPRLVCVSGRTEHAIYSLLNSVSSRSLDIEHIRLIHSIFSKHIPSHQFRGYSIVSKNGEIKRTSQYFSENTPDLYVMFGDMDEVWRPFGAELFTIPVFAATVQRIHDILLLQHNINITEILLGNKKECIKDDIIGSIVVQIGLVDLLNHIGLKPKAFVGVSLGELVCAYYDGILSLEEVVLITAAIHNVLMPVLEPLVQYKVHLSDDQVRKLLPTNVEVSAIISKNEVLISGRNETTDSFVKNLQNKNINVEHVGNSVSFMKKDIKKIESQLSKQLKKIVTNDRKKNGKWLTFLNNLSVVDYIIRSLVNQPKIPEIIKAISIKSVVFEVGSGFITRILEKHLANKKVSTLCLNQEGGNHNIIGLLDTLGCLHNYGYNFEVDKLYPEIFYPVSRGTLMIAPYIKWEHEADWTVFSYKSEINIKTGARVMVVASAANDWKFVNGHLIDGRLLFPASGYLTMVWETFALINNSMTADMAIVFENVKFKRATHLKDIPTEFTVMIQRGSGNFEVIESGSGIVTGTISFMEKDDQLELPLDDRIDSVKMQTKDVYKDLRLRGYNYKGSFKGIVETNLTGDRGLIKWNGNWITFIDNMFQLKILHYDTRALYVPTGIDRLAIDGKKHILYARQFGDNPNIPVLLYSDCDIIKSGGIEVRGLQASSIPRKKARGEPVLEKYVFVPNEIKVDVPLSIRLNMQICLENIMGVKVKAVEVIDESTEEDSEPLASHILAALGDLPLIQASVKLLTKNDITIPNVVVENTKLNTETDCLLVVGSNILRRSQFLHTAFASLKDQGFIISRENPDFDPSKADLTAVNILTIHHNKKETIVMMRKSAEYELPLMVDVFDPNHEFSWIPKLQDDVTKDSNVVIYSQNEPLSGILGFVNCLRREPGGAKVKAAFIVDPGAPRFDVHNSFYVDQLKKNMAVNVLKDGRWGTYRHVLLEKLNEVESEHCYVNVTTKGDLSSLRWISGPLNLNKESPIEKKVVHIYNTSLNFRDIMTASGRISADVITMDRMEQECVQGFEFSGRTVDGKRVMGMSLSGALSNMIAADSYLLYDVPDMWTLEQAATVPVVYSTVMCALVDICKIRRGQAVLIHSGAGGVGQAAISLALFHGCKVYTTCGSEEKRAFLKKRYPQLTDRNIGNSRDTSFVQMIFRETNGRGVDLVLNSLAEEKLMSSVHCLARGGKFVEIGKFDLARNTSFRVALLEKECAFHGIMLDVMFIASPKVKLHLHDMLQRGIKCGAVRPLNTHIFKSDEVEKAFRYMASGKHMGKVIINLKKEEQQKVFVPKALPMVGLPRFYCSDESTYIICGGLGGFGLELADWLILRGARKLVLTSRNGIKTGYQASRIRLWNTYGVTISISTVDMTTRSGCEQMLIEAENLGPVKAIFNLAVVLKDALFVNQTKESFKESFEPKAEATKLLDQVSRKLCPRLKDFVIFSSVSCGRGNPGQTNYGMANSVMERICEKRREEGLPALAIEWGAIGEVGLVAEMQEEHTELEIGGTLQQRIGSCLQVMDTFLKQNHPVVGSMVVAEKRAGAGGADNVVDAVANILGLSDLKTVSMHATLAELGMDSMTAVEIKQSLEREFEVFLSSQEIRSLTFARLQEIEAEREHEVRKGKKLERLPGGIELIVRLMGEESSAKIPMMRLPSKLAEGEAGPKVLLLPGIEGVATILTPLTSNLNCHALCVQFCHLTPEDTLIETATNLLPHFEAHLSRTKPFKMVAYSFGCLLALEVVSMLEQKGYAGTVMLIDGAPKMLFELMKQQVMIESEDQFQTSLLCVLMSLYMPFETILKNREKIFRANGFEERMKTARECAPKDTPHTAEHQRATAIGVYKRLKGLMKYMPSFTKVKSSVKLYRPKHASVHGVPEDYYLSEICESPVEVTMFEANHITILDNPEVADAINVQACISCEVTKTPVIENGSVNVNLKHLEAKQM